MPGSALPQQSPQPSRRHLRRAPPQDALVKIAKKLKKNNVAVDVVSFGSEEANGEKLEAFHAAVNSNDNSHLVTVPPGTILSDMLFGTPIFMEEGAGGGGGGGGEEGAAPAPRSECQPCSPGMRVWGARAWPDSGRQCCAMGMKGKAGRDAQVHPLLFTAALFCRQCGRRL